MSILLADDGREVDCNARSMHNAELIRSKEKKNEVKTEG
jgi:hypothetical protein